MLRRTLRLWCRACGAGSAIFALHSGQPGRFGDRLACSRYAFQYISTPLHSRWAFANILEGIAAVRQPITKPAWLARMKRKGGTISTTSELPQAQGPTQRRRLKSITGFSSRHWPNTKEPFGSASQLQQLRPGPGAASSSMRQPLLLLRLLREEWIVLPKQK